MHADPSAALHEMLIVHHRDVYVRPHLHRGKGESFHVIEGEATVVLFDDRGAVEARISIGAAGSGRFFFYRIPEGVAHTFLIESEWLVFHETTSGPFDPSKTEFMPWAPDGSDADEARSYLDGLA